jgi:hypothetical protein
VHCELSGVIAEIVRPDDSGKELFIHNSQFTVKWSTVNDGSFPSRPAGRFQPVAPH